MTDRNDPLERLRAANPVPIGAVGLLEPDRALFERIVTGAARGPSSLPAGRRRRARRLVPALVGASLLGGAVAYAVLRDDVTKPQSAACYSRADLEADTEVAPVGPDGPVAACALLWRQGAFGGSTEVPPLQECVLSSGVVGVFPSVAGGDVCTTLNLAPTQTTAAPAPTVAPSTSPPPPAPADVAARVIRFRDATVPQFLGVTCMTPEAGADIVRRELANAGLDGWTIAAEGFTPERPCATLSLQPEARRIVLAPAPPRR